MPITKEGKLFVHIVKKEEKNFELAGLSEDKILWFILPSEYLDIRNHKVLLSKSIIKNSINAIKPINGYRRVGISINDDIRKEYFDEEDNLCYKGLPLEESNSMLDISTRSISIEEGQNFIDRIKELEAKLNLNEEVGLHLVEKKFVLEKFEKKINASEWIEQFEDECSRHRILNDTKKIEALRFFVDGSSKDWYESSIKKIGLVNWNEWKRSFFLFSMYL